MSPLINPPISNRQSVRRRKARSDIRNRRYGNFVRGPALALLILWLATSFLGPTALASTVVAWGETSRPPGSPPSMTTNVPAGLVNAIAVAGGPDVGYAIRSNGTVVTWGNPLVA